MKTYKKKERNEQDDNSTFMYYAGNHYLFGLHALLRDIAAQRIIMIPQISIWEDES